MPKKLSALSILAAAAIGFGAPAGAATVGGTVNVSTQLTAACEVSAAGAAIDFGSVVALESSGTKTGDSGAGFQVACSTGLAPKIYSASDRVMTDGTNNLPFNLCLAACDGTNDLATTQGGANDLSITQDGSLHAVTLHGRILAADYKALPAGTYSKTVTVNVDY